MSHKTTNSTGNVVLKLFVLACLGMPVWSQTRPPTPFRQCPAVGADTSCAILIVFNQGGTVSVYADSTQGPYDSSDDTLVGVLNNSGVTQTKLTLSGVGQTGAPIFSFESDGICTFAPFTGSSYCSGAYYQSDPGDYAGPQNTFTGISTDQKTGTIVFTGGLAPGASTYLSLEDTLAATSINVPLATTCPTAAAVANSPYSSQLVGTGGNGSYRWTVASGSLGSLSLSSSGLVSGTPGAGTLNFTLQISDTISDPPQQQPCSIVVSQAVQTLSLTCSASSSATVGVNYSASCSATGGAPPYNWTYNPPLPSWLTGGSAGTPITISGQPTTTGTYNFTVIVTDSTTPLSLRQTKSQAITITVGASTLNINCATPGQATAGKAYSTSCTASGGTAPYSWTYAYAPQQSWLSGGTSGATVNLTGTPPNPPPSSYGVTVTVTDSTTPVSARQIKSQAITITVVVQPVQGVTITQTSISNNQTSLVVSFGQAVPSTYTGTLSLRFTHDATVTNVPATYIDPAGGFPVSASSTSLSQNFTVNQGSTQAAIQFGVGTVAGTWTVTLTALSTNGVSALPSPNPSFTVPVGPAAPSIVAGTVQILNPSSSGFSVQVTGFATTRDVASATFNFTAASGAKLQGTTVSVSFNGQDQSEWFNTAASQAAGGTFKLVLPFSYSGDPKALGSVSVTLTNSRGQTSAPVSGGT
jgi:hypothetical protein